MSAVVAAAAAARQTSISSLVETVDKIKHKTPVENNRSSSHAELQSFSKLKHKNY